MSTAPRYRAEIAGSVKATVDEFESCCRNEIAHSETFVFLVEDCSAHAEYRDWLTEAEMKAAFKRAQRVPA